VGTTNLRHFQQVPGLTVVRTCQTGVASLFVSSLPFAKLMPPLESSALFFVADDTLAREWGPGSLYRRQGS
jgi:hypothetical protein